MAVENDQTLPLAQNPGTDLQPQPQPGPVLTDIDDIELQDALKAAEAEKAADKTPAPDPAAGQVQPQTPAAKDPADTLMIPKGVFDDRVIKEREKTAEAERQAAYWKGRAEAAPAPGQQPQPAAQPLPAQTPEQRVAALDAQIDDLAAKFDNGEITMADFKKQERTLTDQRSAIHEDALVAKVRPAAPANSGQDDLALQTATAQLEDNHPWVKVFEDLGAEAQAEWDMVKTMAIQNLVARKIDPTSGTMGRFELRKEVASLMDKLGPVLLTDRAKAKGIALPTTGQQSTPQAQPQPAKPALSPEAAARLAKLGQANGAPPNLNAMTNTGGGEDGMPSDAAIEKMTEEEISNLPIGVRNKILGIAA